MQNGRYFIPTEAINVFSGDGSQSIATSYIQKCYENVKTDVMGFGDSHNVGNERGNVNRKLFVWFVQLFSAKSATTLMSTAFAAYPVYTILLNVFVIRRQRFISHIHTLVVFLSVCCNHEQLEGEGNEKYETCSCTD